MPIGVYERTKKHKGINHGMFKGDGASYAAKHIWMKTNFGRPQFCEDCRSRDKKIYQWANISGKYNRDRSDWKRLCIKCHAKTDNALYPRGEKQGSSKLTEFEVRRIRLMKEINPKLGQRKMAKMFNVSKPTIMRVLRRLTWAHII